MAGGDRMNEIPLLQRYVPGPMDGETLRRAEDSFWCHTCEASQPLSYLGHAGGTARVCCPLGHRANIVAPSARIERWEKERR